MPIIDTRRDLRGARVGQVPSICYLPAYVSESEERALLDDIAASKAAWKKIKGRRVLELGGSIERGVLLQTKLPRWLEAIVNRIAVDHPVFGDGEPNHVLLNAYPPGEGIHSHQDGPVYFPGVCILSLGGSASMRFRRKLPEGGYDPEACAEVLLQPRSLLIFMEEAYTNCAHGIEEKGEDELHEGICNLDRLDLPPGVVQPRSAERVSLTIRRVLKTRKSLLRL